MTRETTWVSSLIDLNLAYNDAAYRGERDLEKLASRWGITREEGEVLIEKTHFSVHFSGEKEK